MHIAKPIGHNRLYYDLAELFPLMSPPEDYAEEAELWKTALKDTLGTGRLKLLELGVGGGHNLHHLASGHEVVAIDLSEKMLANSIRLNPSVEHHVGDMRSVRLNRTFDAVLIHDAVCYMLTEDDLRAAFTTAAAHLNAGGVLITTPDHFTDTLVVPYAFHRTRTKGDSTLTYVEYLYDPDPRDSTYDTFFVFFIDRAGKHEVEFDHHVTGVFPKETWLHLLDQTGFATELRPHNLHEDGHEGFLIVARKR